MKFYCKYDINIIWYVLAISINSSSSISIISIAYYQIINKLSIIVCIISIICDTISQYNKIILELYTHTSIDR